MTTRLEHCLECDRKVVSRQLCSMHYLRARRKGDLPPREYAVTCIYCDKPTLARDMCDLHYQQFRRKVMGKNNRPSAGPCKEGDRHSWTVKGICRVCKVKRPTGWT